jgi:hypothetical protein
VQANTKLAANTAATARRGLSRTAATGGSPWAG